MSKKDEAFKLYSERKKPSDKEVKALGISARTRYNYFQEFKKSQGEENADIDGLRELKREKARLTLLAQIEELESKRERLPTRVENIERQMEAVIEFLAKVLDNTPALASHVLAMIRSHIVYDHKVSENELRERNSDQEAVRLNDELVKLEPIAENLRKLWEKPRSLK